MNFSCFSNSSSVNRLFDELVLYSVYSVYAFLVCNSGSEIGCLSGLKYTFIAVSNASLI